MAPGSLQREHRRSRDRRSAASMAWMTPSWRSTVSEDHSAHWRWTQCPPVGSNRPATGLSPTEWQSPHSRPSTAVLECQQQQPHDVAGEHARSTHSSPHDRPSETPKAASGGAARWRSRRRTDLCSMARKARHARRWERRRSARSLLPRASLGSAHTRNGGKQDGRVSCPACSRRVCWPHNDKRRHKDGGHGRREGGPRAKGSCGQKVSHE